MPWISQGIVAAVTGQRGAGAGRMAKEALPGTW